LWFLECSGDSQNVNGCIVYWDRGGKGNRILEDYVIKEILILQDSDNRLIPPDSCLSEGYKNRIHQMK
jgi:hypothetical protein